MIRDLFKKRILVQVSIVFVIGVLMIGLVTYFSQQIVSDSSVREQVEERAEETASVVMDMIREYPAYEWLMKYWYEHPDDMDIEYDAVFGTGTETEKKCAILNENYPDIQLEYADMADIMEMSEEDQKLYAEIAYSWLITKVNEVKRASDIEFLYCAITTGAYDTQFFLFSAADEDEVRGTEYGQVYPLGVKVEVNESLQAAMHSAKDNKSHLGGTGEYVDYYAYFGMVKNDIALIGLTFNVSELRAIVAESTYSSTSFAVFLMIILSALCLYIINRIVLRPLKTVQESIVMYKGDKDSAAVAESLSTIKYGNEIGQLSDDVAEMTKAMDDYVEEIRTIASEKERIGAELSLATDIQRAMLPSTFPAFPEREDFDIYAIMEPAREVGGDFYDFFMIDDDHLCMVIADVSGKGIPAALFMMVSKIILKNTAKTGKTPAEILTATNETICGNNKQEMFVTVWLGILDLKTGTLTASNAGHEYPVVMHAGTGYELVKDRHGLVIGGMSGVNYSEYELTLEPGSKLFVYTDGIPEATNNNKEMFGIDRLMDALNADPEASPMDSIESVAVAVRDFVEEAEQFDDLTMLSFEYKGKG